MMMKLELTTRQDKTVEHDELQTEALRNIAKDAWNQDPRVCSSLSA